MSVHRRSTVHDYASLRLHPDGTRVQRVVTNQDSCENSQDLHGVSLTNRLRGQIGRDSKGNWVALDAGGIVSVKNRWNGGLSRRDSAEGGREQERKEESAVPEDTDAHRTARELCHRTRQDRRVSDSDNHENVTADVQGMKDYRAKKRQKFYHDFSFLGASRTGSPAMFERTPSEPVQQPRDITELYCTYSQQRLPVPSADLLKYIHWIASEYYTARGCLYNAPKEARNVKKFNRLARLGKNAAKSDPTVVIEEGNVDFKVSSDNGGEIEITRTDDSMLSDERNEQDDTRKVGRKGPGRRRTTEPPTKPRKDMYRAFDGSALMAIGMLLQEHVTELLSAEAPEVWLKQMEASEELAKNEAQRTKTRSTKVKYESADDDEGTGGQSEDIASQSLKEDGSDIDTDSSSVAPEGDSIDEG